MLPKAGIGKLEVDEQTREQWRDINNGRKQLIQLMMDSNMDKAGLQDDLECASHPLVAMCSLPGDLQAEGREVQAEGGCGFAQLLT